MLVKSSCLFLGLVFIYCSACVYSQVAQWPSTQVAKLTGEIIIDGFLDEPDWKNVLILYAFLTTEPLKKGTPSARNRS
ncbi:MAG: hypothetical protein WBN27_01975 [Eudoraea sp.]|uniref:hypothetical protein n=1 Tax=Eudoraea sp. TaxID=1979955 RepID=UPI003C73C032